MTLLPMTWPRCQMLGWGPTGRSRSPGKEWQGEEKEKSFQWFLAMLHADYEPCDCKTTDVKLRMMVITSHSCKIEGCRPNLPCERALRGASCTGGNGLRSGLCPPRSYATQRKGSMNPRIEPRIFAVNIDVKRCPGATFWCPGKGPALQGEALGHYDRYRRCSCC